MINSIVATGAANPLRSEFATLHSLIIKRTEFLMNVVEELACSKQFVFYLTGPELVFAIFIYRF